MMKVSNDRVYSDDELFSDDYSDIPEKDLLEMNINTSLKDRLIELMNIYGNENEIGHHILTISLYRKFKIKKKSKTVYQILSNMSKEGKIKRTGIGTFALLTSNIPAIKKKKLQ